MVGMGSGESARLASREGMIANLLSLFNEGKDFRLQGLLDFYRCLLIPAAN